MEAENKQAVKAEEISKTEESATTTEQPLSEQEEKEARAKKFLDEYRELSEKHGFSLKAVTNWTIVENSEIEEGK